MQTKRKPLIRMAQGGVWDFSLFEENVWRFVYFFVLLPTIRIGIAFYMGYKRAIR